MADRTRRGPTKSVLKWVKQFTDPKFNPERRTAMQMLAAAPVAGKLKLAESVTGYNHAALEPLNFYKSLMQKLSAAGGEIDPEIGSRLYRDMWDNARSILKGAEYGEQSAFDNLMEGHRLTDALVENSGPFMDGDKDLWDKAVRAFHDAGDGTDDALNEASQNALSEYIDSLDPGSVVAEFGHDDAYSDFFDAEKVNDIHDHLDESIRAAGLDPDQQSTYADGGYRTLREDIAEKLGLPEFLDKAPSLSSATVDDYVDFTDLPEYEYMDPEALRYASLRQLLQHPTLTPNQLMEVTGADPSLAMSKITPKAMAEQLFQKIRPYPPSGRTYEDTIRMAARGEPWVQPVLRPERAVDWPRVHPSVRESLRQQIDEWLVNPKYGYSGPQFFDALRGTRRHLADILPEEFMSHEDLPSYITNRSSLFRLKRPDRRDTTVKPQLNYLDVINALPPEEYSGGGRVG